MHVNVDAYGKSQSRSAGDDAYKYTTSEYLSRLGMMIVFSTCHGQMDQV
jgi:hypothetical protein